MALLIRKTTPPNISAGHINGSVVRGRGGRSVKYACARDAVAASVRLFDRAAERQLGQLVGADIGSRHDRTDPPRAQHHDPVA
jgi:hypothetical protein